MQTQFGAGFDSNYSVWTDNARLRTAIGKAAKASNWFKWQTAAELWVGAISQFLDDIDPASDLNQKLTALRTWIDHA